MFILNALLCVILHVVVICLLIYYYNITSEIFAPALDGHNIVLKKAKPEIISQIYKLIYDVDKILSDADIKYWVEGGTLLGTVRHGGIIPWDDDADIQILQADEAKLVSITKIFSDNNYELVPTWFGYKVFSVNGKETNNPNWKYPSLDIFIVKPDNSKYTYSHWRARFTFGKCYFKIDEIFPLKRMKFGEFSVNVPNITDKYLSRCYGNDWNDIAYRQFDHEYEKHLQIIKVKLTDEDRQPAQPTTLV